MVITGAHQGEDVVDLPVFGSLPELKVIVTERVEACNAESFQKRPGCRTSMFAAEEQSC